MKQTYQAVAKYLRIAPRKLRLMAPLVKGRPVQEALALLSFMPQKAGKFMATALRSAASNAKGQAEDEKKALVVEAVAVDEGPLLRNAKRWRPMPMGRAGRIRHRTSHLRVVVSREVEIKENKKGGKK